MMRLRALSLLFVFLVLLFCLPATVEAQSLSKPLPNPLKMLWLDNDNHPNSLASREAIAEVLDKAKKAGFNVVVPAVRSHTGVAFYASDVASRPGEMEDLEYPRDFDFLQTVIDEARLRNLHVHAGITVFYEGVKFPNRRVGVGFDHPEWQTVYYDRQPAIRISDDPATFPLSVNMRSPDGFSLFTTAYGSAYEPLKVTDGDTSTADYMVVATCSKEGKVTAVTRGTDLVSTIPLTDDSRVLLVTGNAATQPTITTGTRITVTSDKRLYRAEQLHIFLPTNPAHPKVRKRCLAIIREILTRYEVDGIVLDGVGFDGSNTDFSDISRALFEKEMKVNVRRWPEDIYTATDWVTSTPRIKGPLFDKWILWRAQVIRDFINDVHALMKGHQTKKLGVMPRSIAYDFRYDFLGSGENWAVTKVGSGGGFSSPPPGYAKTGFSEMLDYLSPRVSDYALENNRPRFENSIALAMKATGGTIPLAPLIRITNLDTVVLEEALRICIQKNGGVMVFSHRYMDQNGRWGAAQRGLDTVPQLPER